MKSSLDLQKELSMLLGLHIGDSLGATLEFTEPRSPDNFHRDIIGGGKLKWEPGEATDDTDLMICLLQSLVAHGELKIEDLSLRFVDWFHKHPKDIGDTTLRAIQKLKSGFTPDESGIDSEWSQGNGSLMRCAPLVPFYKTDDELKAAAFEQCAVTHAHSVCLACDYLFLTALNLAQHGILPKDILSEVVKKSEQFDDKIADYLELVPDTPWDQLKTGGYVIETLGAALWGLLNTKSFEDAVIRVVNRGGDSDTCGAVTGALAGAFYGLEAIPKRWLNVIKRRKEIEQLLSSLV